MKIWPALRMTAIVLGAMLAVGIGLIALAVGWTIWANGRADRHAAAFCEGIPVPADVAPVAARAEQEGIRQRSMEDGRTLEFLFHGGVFHATACVAEVVDGKIVGARVRTYDD